MLRPALHRDQARKTRNTDSSAVRRPRPGRPPCASGYLTPLPPPGAGCEGFNASSPRCGSPGRSGMERPEVLLSPHIVQKPSRELVAKP